MPYFFMRPQHTITTQVISSTGCRFDFDFMAHVVPVNTVGYTDAQMNRSFQFMPESRHFYLNEAFCGHIKTGTVSVWSAKDGLHPNCTRVPPYVIFLPVRESPSSPAKLSHIYSGLSSLCNAMNVYGITSVSIPALGCIWPNVKKAVIESVEKVQFRYSTSFYLFARSE